MPRMRARGAIGGVLFFVFFVVIFSLWSEYSVISRVDLHPSILSSSSSSSSSSSWGGWMRSQLARTFGLPSQPSASSASSSSNNLLVQHALTAAKIQIQPVCSCGVGDGDQDEATLRTRIARQLQDHAYRYAAARIQSMGIYDATSTSTSTSTSPSQSTLVTNTTSHTTSSFSSSSFPSSLTISTLRSIHQRCSRGIHSRWHDSHIQELMHKPDFNISSRACDVLFPFLLLLFLLLFLLLLLLLLTFPVRLKFVRYDEITTTLTAEQDALGRGVITWDDYGARIEHPCMYPSGYINRNVLEMKPMKGEKEGERHGSRDEFHTFHEYSTESRVGAKYLSGNWIGWVCGTANMWHSFVDDMIDVFAVMDQEKFDYVVQLPATPEHQDLTGVGGFVALLGVAWMSSFPNLKLVYWPDQFVKHDISNKPYAICLDKITYPRKTGNRRGPGFSYLTSSMMSRLRRGVYSMLSVGDSEGNLPEVLTHVTVPSRDSNLIDLNEKPTTILPSGTTYRVTVYDRQDASKRVWLNARDLLARIAPHHKVLYIDKMPLISAQDQLRIYANTDILIAEHGAGQMATMFLPRGAITLQVTSWWDQTYGYLTQLEKPSLLGLRSGTVACSTWDSKPFTGTNQSAMPKSHHSRNGEHTICNPDTILERIKHVWGIDLTA